VEAVVGREHNRWFTDAVVALADKAGEGVGMVSGLEIAALQPSGWNRPKAHEGNVAGLEPGSARCKSGQGIAKR